MITVSNNSDIINKTNNIFIEKIIPSRIIIDKNAYEITYIDKMYHISGFIITTENKKLCNVKILGFHPNCDPDTDVYCLPEYKKGIKITDDIISSLITNIKTYYLDSCFFNPVGRYVKYKKMKSIYIQMNK